MQEDFDIVSQPDLGSPVLVMVRGLPGSGKSYLSYALQRKIGESNVVVLDPDAIDYEGEEYSKMSKALSVDGVDEKLYPYRFLRSKGYDAIDQGKIVVWNQAFTNLYIFNRTIENLQNYAKDRGVNLPCVVVEVTVDIDIAKERVKGRENDGGHGVDDDNFSRFVTDYVTFSDQGHDVVAINGTNDVEESVQKIIQATNKATKDS